MDDIAPVRHMSAEQLANIAKAILFERHRAEGTLELFYELYPLDRPPRRAVDFDLER